MDAHSPFGRWSALVLLPAFAMAPGCGDPRANADATGVLARGDDASGGADGGATGEGGWGDSGGVNGSDGGFIDARAPDGPPSRDSSPSDSTADQNPPSTDAGAPDDAALPDVRFAPTMGLDPGGLARPIGDAFAVTGRVLISDETGASWLLWDERANPASASRTPHLDHFDASGVYVHSSPLEATDSHGFVLHGDESLTSWRNHCGTNQATTCFYQNSPTGVVETEWSRPTDVTTAYLLDSNGDVTGSSMQPVDRRVLTGAVAMANDQYVVTREGRFVIHRLAADLSVAWSQDIVPAVTPPLLAPDAPLDELLGNAALGSQSVTSPVATTEGVVVGAVVTRGTIDALNTARGLGLPLPAAPRCGAVLVLRLDGDGTDPRYFLAPTQHCAQLPKLAVADGHAFVASVVGVAEPSAPSDTEQYDIGLTVVNLATGNASSHTYAFEEDDVVESIAPCGFQRACLVGVTGSRSVDTGSRVTFGDGFILPVSSDGTAGELWRLTSTRHSVIRLAARGAADSLLVFATTNGPITHTADNDPSLGYNDGLLGVVSGL